VLFEVASAIRFEEINSIQGLNSIRKEWSSLWMRCPSSTPFQSPEWLIPWWRHLGYDELFCVALWHGQTLVGLVPLAITNQGTERTVLLLGTGVTDYLDGLWDPAYEEEAIKVFVTHLTAQHFRWDVCDFQELRPSSPLLKDCEILSHFSEEILIQENCPVLSLQESAGKKPLLSRLKDYRYFLRKIEKLGRVQFLSPENSSLAELLESLFRLHRARWAAKGCFGVLADRPIQFFHAEASVGLLQRGLLRLCGLRLEGRIVAIFYGFADKTRIYFYLGGFDPSLEHLSLGTIMVGHVIEEALHEGVQEFDFLRGQENYKYKWGAVDRPNYRRRIRQQMEKPSLHPASAATEVRWDV
jgi:CelD/BcsL family acetyltransferase involved in cellulose biosynthesis